MLTPNLKSKITAELKREVIILRQVVYKEIQEWKRKYGLPGYDIDQIKLTDKEKKFIDEEIQYFLFAEIPQELIDKKAKIILKDLQSVEKPTLLQKEFKQDLESALTINNGSSSSSHQPFNTSKKVGAEEQELTVEDIPF